MKSRKWKIEKCSCFGDYLLSLEMPSGPLTKVESPTRQPRSITPLTISPIKEETSIRLPIGKEMTTDSSNNQLVEDNQVNRYIDYLQHLAPRNYE